MTLTLSADLVLDMLLGMSPDAKGPLRVRQVLDGMTEDETKQLKKLLPSEPKMPSAETARYPAALLKLMGYSGLGVVAEELLQLPTSNITPTALTQIVKKVWPLFSYEPLAESAVQKMIASKTTEPFLALVRTTKELLDTKVTGLRFNTEVYGEGIVGHPDARTDTHVVEVKLTGQLLKNWTYFKLQTYAYAALDSSITNISIVLPLQQTVCTADCSSWGKRDQFKALLQQIAKRMSGVGSAGAGACGAGSGCGTGCGAPPTMSHTDYGIGSHQQKLPSLVKTIQALPPGPSQIFLGSPQSAKLSISDLELAQAAEALANRPECSLYIHSPYIINLASNFDYQLDCLRTLLEYGATIGAKGVVVHVGKSTTQTTEAAVAAMRANVAAVLSAATPECPLLLETPAGQGTELLRSYEEFVGFVKDFATPTFRICVDTCHIFACGHAPKVYLERLLEDDASLLTLVHFNDSMDLCGACKDRHAYPGQGKIGTKTMIEIAELCRSRGIPAVVE